MPASGSDNTNEALLSQMALAWIERANQIKTNAIIPKAPIQLGPVSPKK
jgi:hypothetical protein